MFQAYNKTYFRPGQKSAVCPTGVQFPTGADDALGAAPYMPGGKMQGTSECPKANQRPVGLCVWPPIGH